MDRSMVRSTMGASAPGFEVDGEDLNFVDALAGWQVDGFRGEFVFPDDFADLGREAAAKGAAGASVGVELGFREGAVEFGLWGVGEHPSISQCRQ